MNINLKTFFSILCPHEIKHPFKLAIEYNKVNITKHKDIILVPVLLDLNSYLPTRTNYV